MYDYVRRFGFGSRSGIVLPAESNGLFRKLNRWGKTSLASIAMGHEVSTTSIQLARACAAIANGGLLIKPKLILKQGDTPTPTDPPKRILKPQTAITMRQMMEGVVISPHGTAHRSARLAGYTSGGKTGTAQIFDLEAHHYTHEYNASFMGFAPVTNPAFIVVVTLNGTAGNAGMGGAAAAPVFKEVATEALRVLDVPKDLPEASPEASPEPEEPSLDDTVRSSDCRPWVLRAERDGRTRRPDCGGIGAEGSEFPRQDDASRCGGGHRHGFAGVAEWQRDRARASSAGRQRFA